MTWIIGATTVFGYGALISDVEVTFSNRARADLIQKAFPITKYIGAGFAGSVKIGFSLINELEQLASTSPETESITGVDPIWIANNFSTIARSVFSKHSKNEKELQSHILLVGVSPTEHRELGARIYLIRMVSPHFIPGIMGEAIKVCSIGSGAHSKELKRRIKPLVRHTSNILQAETGRPGGWGEMFSFSVTRALQDNPIQGISPHHHLMLIRHGAISMSNNDENIYTEDNKIIKFRMPNIATNYSEFLQLCNAAGYSSAEASC